MIDSMCSASHGNQTTIAFADGLVMARCSHCDQQQWMLNDEPITTAHAQSLLAGRFTAMRGRRDLSALRQAKEERKIAAAHSARSGIQEQAQRQARQQAIADAVAASVSQSAATGSTLVTMPVVPVQRAAEMAASARTDREQVIAALAGALSSDGKIDLTAFAALAG